MLKRVWLAVLALVLSTIPALAEEIIYFTNGTSMPVRSHEVEGDMIKVDLGGDAFMAFPMSQVDRIEQAGGDVLLRPSSRANQIIAPDPSNQVYATPVRSGATGRDLPPEPSGIEITPDSKGVASYAPFANSGHPAKAKMRIAGDQNVFNHQVARSPSEGVMGASRIGQRAVMPSKVEAKRPLSVLTKREDEDSADGSED